LGRIESQTKDGIVTHSVFLVEEVYADLLEAARWYKNQKEGLQEEFIDSFEQAIERIQINPFGYQLKTGKVRYVMLQRFPYKIFYKFAEQQIKIYGVIHAKRAHKHIRKRLR
jgi:hypothetical protein